MSKTVRIYIPDELADRIDQQRGDQSVQEYTLAALRSAVHGSPVEVELRRQIGDLLDILRALGKPEPPQIETSPLLPALRVATEDKRIGW
jgi:hypothetical protein